MILSKMTDLSSILYFGMQMLDRDACLAILVSESERNSEIDELLPGMEEEEALCYLHEAIGDMPPRPHRDHYEIGYPAKLRCKLLESEGWKIREVRRYGTFQRNQLLADNDIVDELCGSEGVTGQS